MKKGYTKLITAKITKLNTGDIITPDSFPNIPRASTITILNRLSHSGNMIEHVKRGVFSKIKITKFGKAKATPLEILSNEIHNDDNKCFGGLFLFNLLGLTTQIPTIIEVLNNKSSYKTKFGNTKIHYVKIRPRINKKTKRLIQTLEVIKKINKIPDANLNESIIWIENKLNAMNPKDLTFLVELSNEYNPRVRAILGSLLAKSNSKLSNKIKRTLNENSYYRIGSLIEYINNPAEWSLKK